MELSNIYDADKWEQFCRKMLEKTRRGELIWKPQPNIVREEVDGLLYAADFDEWRFLVYQYRWCRYDSEFDKYRWDTEIAIEVIDQQGNKLWTIPTVNVRQDLYDCIQFGTSKIRSLFEKMMAEAV